SMSACQHVSMSACQHVSMSACQHVSMSACFFGRQHSMTTIIFYSKKFALFLKMFAAFIESGPLKV
ncbi:hypothetical protein, partial [Salmonella enterica]